VEELTSDVQHMVECLSHGVFDLDTESFVETT
jgi:hypothetical protein